MAEITPAEFGAVSDALVEQVTDELVGRLPSVMQIHPTLLGAVLGICLSFVLRRLLVNGLSPAKLAALLLERETCNDHPEKL